MYSVEMDLNSVERIQEYLELEQEPPTIITNARPSAAWPTEGCLSINNLHIRYAPDLETVLRGLTFETKAKEKIGVVGRYVDKRALKQRLYSIAEHSSYIELAQASQPWQCRFSDLWIQLKDPLPLME